MSDATRGVPAWAWDLIIAVQKCAEEHPPLYRQEVGGDRYVSTQCLDGIIQRHIPYEVWEVAAVLAEDRRRREQGDQS